MGKSMHSILLKDTASTPEALAGRCACLAWVATLAFDRTEEGEKDTAAGVAWTDSQLKAMGFEGVTRIQRETPNVQVLVVYNSTDIVVAFRGTCNSKGWAVNVDFGKTLTEIGEVHQGWYKDVEAVAEDIRELIMGLPGYKAMRLWVTGHSKGAAEQQIAAAVLDQDIPVEGSFGIGCPAPFSKETAARVGFLFNGRKPKDFSWRMLWAQHNNDLVCDVPPAVLGYSQAGKYVYLTSRQKVEWNSWAIGRFFDGLWGKTFSRERMVAIDSLEDHHPCYYVNGFCEAAGVSFRAKRWLDKYV